MAAAQYVDVPGYSALLLRRTFPDLMQSGALIPRSKEWWSGKASWNAQNKRWTFPSGATITFGYLETDDDVYQYQGAEFQFVGIDELTQHSEWRYGYPMSRLRRPSDGPLSRVPLRMRAGTNPGGVGHAWVKARFGLGRDAQGDRPPCPPGRAFVPAQLEDNPHLDQEAYRESLAGVDPLTRAQLLTGDWDAVAGGRFRSEWFRRRYRWRGTNLCLDGLAPVELARCVVFGTADTAASAKEESDWTVICAWAVTPSLDLVWLDMDRGHWELPEIVPRMRALYDRWRMAYLAIEGGGTQKGACQLASRDGMIVKEMNPSGTGGKLVRATPAIVHAEAGKVWLPDGAAWLADALAELVLFTGDEKKDAHDDIVDALAYAALRLDRRADEKASGILPRVVARR